MANKKLFDDDETSEEEVDKGEKLSINKSYADNYEKWRRKEDYQKLKDKYGTEALYSDYDDSDTSEEGDLAEPDNPDFDLDFFRVLAAIKLKHPVLKEDRKFFKDSYQSQAKRKKEDPEEKPFTIRDHERKVILERGGRYEDEEEDEEPQPGPSWRGRYDEGDYELREKEKPQFRFEDDLDEEEDDGTLFTKRESSSKEEEDKAKENAAVEFLQGRKDNLKDELDEQLLRGLKKEWGTSMSAKDKYLMDYFVNQRYLEEEDEDTPRDPHHFALDLEPFEEDEKTFDKMEEFETKYRFRFEDPDAEFLKRHPRLIEDTLRKKDPKRKEVRERRKTRKEEQENQREQEILRLRAFRRKEILERIEQLKEVAGVGTQDLHDFENMDLDADFDPATHDTAMNKIFDDKYYAGGTDETEKPVFEDEELNRELQEEYDKLEKLDTVMTKGTYRYMDVLPNNYGLDTEEILCAKDSELNRWYSLKKMLRFGQREEAELRDKKNYEHRATLYHTKRKIFPSLYTDNIEEEWDAEVERKRKRNFKKRERKLRRMREQGLIPPDEDTTTTTTTTTTSSKTKTKTGTTTKTTAKKKKKKKEEEKLDGEEEAKEKVEEKKLDGEEEAKEKVEEEALGEDRTRVPEETETETEAECGVSATVNGAIENVKEAESGSPKKKKKKGDPVLNGVAPPAPPTGKRKRDPESHSGGPKGKKSRGEKKKDQLYGISAARLAAYGQNPKKVKRVFKYCIKDT